MRKRILLVTLLVSVVGILLLSVLFSAVFYEQTLDRTRSQLKIYMGIYRAEFADSPLTAETARAARRRRPTTRRRTRAAQRREQNQREGRTPLL